MLAAAYRYNEPRRPSQVNWKQEWLALKQTASQVTGNGGSWMTCELISSLTVFTSLWIPPQNNSCLRQGSEPDRTNLPKLNLKRKFTINYVWTVNLNHSFLKNRFKPVRNCSDALNLTFAFSNKFQFIPACFNYKHSKNIVKQCNMRNKIFFR